MTPFTVSTVITYTPLWVRRGYTTFSEEYRKIRATMSYQGFNCFKCGGRFSEDESIAVVCLQGVGNKVFCDSCASALE